MITESLVHDNETFPEDFDQLIDMVAGPAHVKHERTSLESIELRNDGTIHTPTGQYRFTQDFLEHAAKAIGMPLGYAYRVSTELFCENFNSQKYVTTCPVTVCHVGDIATGLTLDKKAHYRPASNLTVLQELQKSGVFDLLDFRRASVSYSGVDVELVKKDLVVEPNEGDIIEIGIAFSNSENGGRRMMAEAYSYRLVCTNGSRMGEHLCTARWPSDPRLTDRSSMAAFTKDLLPLVEKLELIKELYGHLDERLSDTELNGLWRRVAYVASSTAADAIIGLSAQDRKALQTTLKKRPFELPAVLTDFNTYELHNRITHAAHERSFLERRKLQEIGGNLLERSLGWAAATAS